MVLSVCAQDFAAMEGTLRCHQPDIHSCLDRHDLTIPAYQLAYQNCHLGMQHLAVWLILVHCNFSVFGLCGAVQNCMGLDEVNRGLIIFVDWVGRGHNLSKKKNHGQLYKVGFMAMSELNSVRPQIFKGIWNVRVWWGTYKWDTLWSFEVVLSLWWIYNICVHSKVGRLYRQYDVNIGARWKV